jgi:hypothetical protein
MLVVEEAGGNLGQELGHTIEGTPPTKSTATTNGAGGRTPLPT